MNIHLKVFAIHLVYTDYFFVKIDFPYSYFDS